MSLIDELKAEVNGIRAAKPHIDSPAIGLLYDALIVTFERTIAELTRLTEAVQERDAEIERLRGVVANVKKGLLTKPREWWVHLRKYGKRRFWKGERQKSKQDNSNEPQE